ncbi:MAG: response regulator [Candidatus Eisenbacteria bacterium]|nr:response regulator [Candidatus Latescibacterota bacterium]MBD3301439.1 response regulator [Candidatus Eisenbacteria bacterium]
MADQVRAPIEDREFRAVPDQRVVHGAATVGGAPRGVKPHVDPRCVCFGSPAGVILAGRHRQPGSRPDPDRPWRRSLEPQNRILIVDDHESVRTGLRAALEEFGYRTIDEAPDAETGLQKILEQPPDLIIVDLNLPGRSGLDLVADLQKRGIETTMIVLTAHASIETAIEATRRGVFDYLTKPAQPDRLRTVVGRGLERTAMRRELLHLRREMLRSGRLQELVGRSPGMLELYRMIEQVAPTTAGVLISGESGTGKEVIAGTVHRLSPRSARPFVVVNCAAIPATLLESELFGHEKGAFTGATAARTGCFEQADGGTLFLDEIGEMSVDLQSKLLRALENGRFRRVGGDREIAVDVRIVAATNADLKGLLAEGRFREDLYFRLNVFGIAIPPLRERREDVALLADHFLQQHLRQKNDPITGFSDAALRLMERYAWPGNVRELRNAVHRAAILCSGGEILPEHLPPAVRGEETSLPRSGSGVFLPDGTSIAEAERMLIFETLRTNRWNKSKAAEILGISLKTLYNRLNQYEAEKTEQEGTEADQP